MAVGHLPPAIRAIHIPHVLSLPQQMPLFHLPTPCDEPEFLQHFTSALGLFPPELTGEIICPSHLTTNESAVKSLRKLLPERLDPAPHRGAARSQSRARLLAETCVGCAPTRRPGCSPRWKSYDPLGDRGRPLHRAPLSSTQHSYRGRDSSYESTPDDQPTESNAKRDSTRISQTPHDPWGLDPATETLFRPPSQRAAYRQHLLPCVSDGAQIHRAAGGPQETTPQQDERRCEAAHRAKRRRAREASETCPNKERSFSLKPLERTGPTWSPSAALG